MGGYGKGTIFLSLPFLAFGSYFALAGFKFIPLAGTAYVPLDVLGMVGISFFIIGFMIFFYGVKGIIEKNRSEKTMKERPHEPWLSDYPWQRRGIKDKASKRVISSFTLFVFLFVFLGAFNWLVIYEKTMPIFAKIIVLIFDIALLAVFYNFLYKLFQYFKFGTSFLRYKSFPFYLGEELRVSFMPRHFKKARITFRFIEERMETRGSGNNQSQALYCYEHFKAEKFVTQEHQNIPMEIVFDIPYSDMVNSLQAVTIEDDLRVKYWEIMIESEMKGIDFLTTFPVPVYKRP